MGSRIVAGVADHLEQAGLTRARGLDRLRHARQCARALGLTAGRDRGDEARGAHLLDRAWQSATLPLWLLVVSAGQSWQYGDARVSVTSAPTPSAVTRLATGPSALLAAAIIAGPRILFVLAVASAPSLIEATAATVRAWRVGTVSVRSANHQLHAAGIREVLEVGNLVTGGRAPDTVVLLRRLLRGADDAEMGLVAAARDDVRDKYLRIGFRPVVGANHTLARPPGGASP